MLYMNTCIHYKYVHMRTCVPYLNYSNYQVLIILLQWCCNFNRVDMSTCLKYPHKENRLFKEVFAHLTSFFTNNVYMYTCLQCFDKNVALFENPKKDKLKAFSILCF